MEGHPAAEAPGCSLGSNDRAARRLRWQSLRSRAAIDAAATPHGFRLTFQAGPHVEEELRELVSLELDCCSFADWSLLPVNGRLVLEVSAGSEAARAVRQMFGIAS